MGRPAAAGETIRQHLIDPEICIRCNTCEETCPVNAVTHDARNYVVDPAMCNSCNDCIAPCPTGAIDNWRRVTAQSRSRSTSSSPGTACRRSRRRDAAAGLPAEVADHGGRDRGPGRRRGAAVVGRAPLRQPLHDRSTRARDRQRQFPPDGRRTRPPTSGTSCSISAARRSRCWRARRSASCRPVSTRRQAAPRAPLLGREPARRRAAALQQPRAHREARDRGPRRPAGRGVASNYLCDRAKGDEVQVVGPYGTTFLMPNHPGSSLLMVCTGTGSAPMRAMTERRRRRIALNEGGG